jgi:outer membrane protein OmpA-like peptidoglycan-associated protein/tetratricopeptide (TPR) repeat protein
MKKYLFSILLFGSLNLFGQKIATQYADIYFEFFHFKEAANYYETALAETKTPDKKQYLYEQLSQSYKYLFQYPKAERYFDLYINSGESVKPEYYIDYANILKLNGKYELAKKMYKKYQEVTGTDLAEPFIRSVSWAIRNADTITNYDVFQTNLNISGQSLGYCFYDDGLIYSHAKPTKGKLEMPLFDLDYARKESNTEFVGDLKLMSLIEFDLNEGAPSVSHDGTKLYFSANATKFNKSGKVKNVNGVEVSSEGISNFKIYMAASDGGMFQKPVELPFNDEEYSCIHPCILKDGTLIFSSNMPGGFGGFDLYKSVSMTDGTWSDPVNLGKKVNTEENEIFPWVDNEMLYFASKGFNNYGGYDLFISKLNSFKMPVSLKNMGQPINSFRDDVAFITHDDARTGYFSSNRDNELGEDAVYYFSEGRNPNATDLAAIDEESEKDSAAQKAAAAGIAYVAPVDSAKPATISKPTTVATVSKPVPPVAAGVAVGTTAVIAGTPQKDKPNVPPAAVVGTTAVIAGTTEKDKPTPQKTTKEPIPATAAIPPSKQTKVNTREPVYTSSGNKNDLLNRRFTPVMFAFNISDITSSQMQSADSIATLLKANKGYKAYITAHTDSRGSFEYNMKLSERRAASVKRYLMSIGIPASRIITKGLSESQLLNECADDVTCTSEQHAINRRVEMKLVR